MSYHTNKPKVISTFSGCGGSSMGYHMAGYDVLMAVEMNKHAVETYKLNFPETKVYHGDIHDLSVEQVLDMTGLKVGELDLFDGSPPCQGFSTAGKRDYCDPKNQLYNEYVRLLKGLQPKTFVMENVKGLITGNMKLIFKDILTQLKNCGYDVQVKLMNAMYYGCATSRQRVIFIGVRKDLGIPASHPNPQTEPMSIKECLEGFESQYNTEITNEFIVQNFHKAKIGKTFRNVHPNKSYFNYYKVDVNKPCPTITLSGYKSLLLGDEEVEGCIEPDEAALLQSFPPDFKWIGTPNQRWERIGNSVPPNLMKAIALHIRKNILEKADKQ